MNLNRERLRRVHEALAPRQRAFLDVLALLFHTNHPLMPGYVGKDVPQGLCDYTPDATALARAAKLARSFEYRRRALRVLDIHALYLMGSIGSIAHSSHSDFDVWLCHRPDLPAPEVARLQDKCAAVSRWAASLGLEVHFFCLAAEHFRKGDVTDLSSESSGTAQHHLLLDEFYRTGLLVAGRYPLWWLVPPAHTADYGRYAESLREKRFVQPNECLDFGAVGEMPAAEFLGAALWQLFKGVSSPHKSVLKILLLESYAAEFPAIEPLSECFKRAVYTGEAAPEALDPYVLLLRRIEGYLDNLQDRERLELARRCFYFKLAIPLSAARASAVEDWRRELLRAIVREWRWRPALVAELDGREHWKIDRVMEERVTLVSALTHSYKVLSDFARRNADAARVSERDMTILGRRLFAVFEHKAGKIDVVNHGISLDLSEDHLSIHKVPSPAGEVHWLLFRGTVKSGELPAGDALKRAWSPMELVAWCHFNGLLHANTRILVVGEPSLDGQALLAVTAFLRQHFPPALVEHTEVDSYAAPARLLRAGLLLNLAVDPLESYTRRGQSLTSNQTDALSYGALGEVLTATVDYLAVTSWGEIFTFRHTGVEGLLEVLCEHLGWMALSPEHPPGLHAHCTTPGHAATIVARVRALFDDVTAWYGACPPRGRHRYVLRGGARYHALALDDGVASPDFAGTHDELLRYLGHAGGGFTTVTFDSRARELAPLAALYEQSAPGVIQLGFQVLGERQALVYVVDEQGALFHQRLPFHTQAALLGQFVRFFESVQIRQRDRPGRRPGVRAPVRCFRMVAVRGGNLRLLALEPPRADQQRRYLDVQAIATPAGGALRFDLFCDGREFSALEHGSRVFHAAARHVLSRRRGGADYPVYITDVDISRVPGQTGEDGACTADYLHYKQRIEAELSAAVAEL